jgi:5-methylcytosine-specific restriction endonuclease McrA
MPVRKPATFLPRNCEECGTTFKPRSGNAKYCERCRDLVGERRKAEWASDNPELRREAARRYVEKHPERRAASVKAAWLRLRSDPNRYETFLLRGRESYARHPETAYLYALNWRGENRERVRSNNRQAASRRRTQTQSAIRSEVRGYASILRHDPCSYCGGSAGCADHIEPLASGGEHSSDNLTAACRRCNARKRTRTLLRFLLEVAQ